MHTDAGTLEGRVQSKTLRNAWLCRWRVRIRRSGREGELDSMEQGEYASMAVAVAWTAIGSTEASATKDITAEQIREFEAGAGAHTADPIVALDFRLELGELLGLDVEYPFEVGAHLAEGEDPLTDDAAGLIRAGIVANDYRRRS